MTRAPYSMPKPEEAFPRTPPTLYDTTLGWRYPNPRMKKRFELIGMGETAENVATKYGISRQEQDEFALGSHQKAAAAWEKGAFAGEITPVEIPQKKGAPVVVERDECVRPDSSLAALAKLPATFGAPNPQPRRHRTQRSLRSPEPRVHACSGPFTRTGEPARRSHRARTPHRCIRRAHRGDATRRHACRTARQARPVHIVHRRGTGYRHGVRAGVTAEPATSLPPTRKMHYGSSDGG